MIRSALPLANRPPVASDQAVSTPAGTPVNIVLSANDADGDTLTYSIGTGPTSGGLSGGGANRTYTPNAGFSGADSFTFRANDGNLDSNLATVSISVLPLTAVVVVYVQGASITNDAGGTTIAKAFTTSNVSGNLIVAAVSWGNNSAVTCSDSQGNSYAVATTQYDSTNNQSLAICYAANVKGGANTVTARFGSSAGYQRLLIHEYQGVALNSPVDVVAKNVANGTTGSNAITSTAAITTVSGDLIFGAVVDDSGAFTTMTAGTGFTQRQSNNFDMTTEDLVQTAAGSVAATQTFGATHRYLAQMVAFKHR